mmetsp:Transcript_1376/g.2973  ORF Transcript_1376/g.2973 Transcript_1376/m.2973 type:complete len:343 (+) Transcript_1376:3-1031(+)
MMTTTTMIREARPESRDARFGPLTTGPFSTMPVDFAAIGPRTDCRNPATQRRIRPSSPRSDATCPNSGSTWFLAGSNHSPRRSGAGRPVRASRNWASRLGSVRIEDVATASNGPMRRVPRRGGECYNARARFDSPPSLETVRPTSFFGVLESNQSRYSPTCQSFGPSRNSAVPPSTFGIRTVACWPTTGVVAPHWGWSSARAPGEIARVPQIVDSTSVRSTVPRQTQCCPIVPLDGGAIGFPCTGHAAWWSRCTAGDPTRGEQKSCRAFRGTGSRLETVRPNCVSRKIPGHFPSIGCDPRSWTRIRLPPGSDDILRVVPRSIFRWSRGHGNGLCSAEIPQTV